MLLRYFTPLLTTLHYSVQTVTISLLYYHYTLPVHTGSRNYHKFMIYQKWNMNACFTYPTPVPYIASSLLLVPSHSLCRTANVIQAS